jgi:hypothetical protein
MIVRLTLIDALEFEKQIEKGILLPSKMEQINNLKKLADKFDPKEVVVKKENSHPEMKSKYMDVNNTQLLKQKKLLFIEEVNSYFLDWRLKEYLTLKGVNSKLRQYYVLNINSLGLTCQVIFC